MSKSPVIEPIKPVPISGPGARSAKLNFVLSCRDLPLRERGLAGATKQDPYIKWSYYDKTFATKDFKEMGRTKHRINEPNPDFFDCVLSFDWMEGQGQIWRFEVIDFDPVNKDDPMGEVEVNVDSYVVDHKEEFYAKLRADNKGQGSLLIKKCEPIKFRLAARDLPHLDPLDGKSDPYVECFWSFGADGPQTLFYKTKYIKNLEECKWDDVIEFANYQKGTNQYWTFKVFDKDPLPKDDVIGECKILVDEFVNSKNIFIDNLSCKSGGNAKLLITPIVS